MSKLRYLFATLLLTASCLLSSCHHIAEALRASEAAARADELRNQIAPHLDVLGARNWIVVADPAYPILAGEGVDVVVVDADLASTLREVLSALDEDGTLTPRLWLCSELEAVSERRAPGVRRYRRELRKLTARRLHYEVTDRIISLQLTQAAQTHRILYIKTSTPLPYSSIAIELDSGYWNSSDEAELRNRMERMNAPTPPRPLPRIESSNYSDLNA